jgi:autotransporter-associated beta strand protein
MHQNSVRLPLAVVAFCTAAHLAFGQTWVGNSFLGSNWDANFIGNYQNWSGGALPGNNATVTFGSNFNSGNPDLNGSRQVGNVVINAIGPFTIVGKGSDTLRINTGNITRQNIALGEHVISTQVQLGNHGTWAVEGLPAFGKLTVSNTVSGAGVFGITKTGAGTLVLSAANTYSGDTAVQAGTLLVNNSTGSGTGTGSLSVRPNAILGGSGHIGSPAEIVAGATIQPGNSIGTLTFKNNLTLENNCKLDMEIGGATSDLLRVTAGTFTASGTVDLAVSLPGPAPSTTTYALINWEGSTAPGVSLSNFVLRPGSIKGQLYLLGPTLRFTMPSVIYVKALATGANTGTSWTDAYTDLQSALAAANAGTEIWVAAGTYYPTATATPSATFQLESGVAIYGGFPGVAGQEGVFSVRNYATHATILSGEIPGSNSRHVVTGSGTNNTAILDGFTIRDGLGNNDISFGQFGAGIYNSAGSPTIANCSLQYNFSWFGAAMCNISGSAPIILNCTFFANSAFAGSRQGGAVYNQQSSPVFRSCSFSGNSAVSGGAIYNHVASPTLVNCILWGNSGTQMVNSNGASVPTVRYSCIAGGWVGVGNILSDPLFVDAVTYDLRLQADSPCIGAGENVNLQADVSDMDGDFDKVESIPFDLAGASRVTVAALDMGAYENQSPATPNRPTGLVATPVDDDSIQLEWDDNADADLDGYNVYRSTVPGFIPTATDLIASLVSDSEYLDNGLDSSVLYYYIATAVDVDGKESTPSLPAQATPKPTAPTALTATAVSSTHINLNWADNPETDLLSYKIYRGLNSGFALDGESLIATIPATTSTFLDEGRTAGETYYYRVLTVDNAGGGSLPSDEASATPAASATIIYVNAANPEGGSGSNWADAFKELRTALQVAESGDQIWVAVGTYKPGNAETSTFAMKNDVAMYGGFAGTETAVEQRPVDPDRFVVDPIGDSVLDGDVGAIGHPNDNTFHVLTGHGTNGSAILDGFTVTQGRADGAPNPNYENIGGGIYINNGSPTIRNCSFISNLALVGGGICCIGGDPMTIENCIFYANATGGGGNAGAAIYIQAASHTLLNCRFAANQSGTGGAVFSSGGAHATAINCLFTGNGAAYYGGAVATGSIVGSQTTLINCTLTGNSSPLGSAVSTGDVGAPRLTVHAHQLHCLG